MSNDFKCEIVCFQLVKHVVCIALNNHVHAEIKLGN